MSTFVAELDIDERKITVSSDTFWSCSCDGDIFLSKYSGEGNDVIELLDVEDLIVYDGIVYFSYGDERCDYPLLSVQYRNNCPFTTYPEYVFCKKEVEGKMIEERVIFFNYKTNRDSFTFVVENADNQWEVADAGGHIYFANGNSVMIIANNDNDFIIKPIECTAQKYYVHVRPILNEN